MSAVIDQRLENGTVAFVVSSSSNSYGYLRAQRLGIPTIAFDKKMDWDEVLKQMHAQRITHIFLLGFMKIVPLSFLQKWQKPIFNVHPSLLPSYPGLNSIRRAYDDGADVGVTVHAVTAAVDAGEIVMQRIVAKARDIKSFSFEELEQKVHFSEYDSVRKSLKAVSCWT
jgi:phosphoribosylglycinamide formyltransferase 1